MTTPRPNTHSQDLEKTTGSTILVIDDEEIIRTIAEKILTHAGYNVVLADSGASGVSLFQNHPESVAAVMIDMNMLGMTGMQTIQALREIDRDLPVLLCSGDILDRDDLPPDGFERVWFLRKPFRVAQLTAIFTQLLSEPTLKGK